MNGKSFFDENNNNKKKREETFISQNSNVYKKKTCWLKIVEFQCAHINQIMKK